MIRRHFWLCLAALSLQAGLSGTGQAQTRFSYSINGSEVTDSKTGLIWQRCSAGQSWSGGTCTGTATTYNHEEALIYAQTQTGWRLPNIKELSSLVDRSRINPAIDVTAFPVTSSTWYWSSSPYAGDPVYAWNVYFGDGNIGYGYGSYARNIAYQVRLVRPSSVSTVNNLFDTFDGSVLDATKWSFHANNVAYGGSYAMSGSELTFSKSHANTLNKLAFSGSKIVIEARIAGKGSMRDSGVHLYDYDNPADSINAGDTNYWSWGLYIGNSGAFNLIGANINRSAPTGSTNMETNGVSFSTYKVIRLTIEGNLITLERGDSINALTEKMQRTMSASIVGRRFYLLIGTGAPDYTPGSFDYVSVHTY